MVMLILTWTGVVVGLGLLLLMALGPVIVELDSRHASTTPKHPSTMPKHLFAEVCRPVLERPDLPSVMVLAPF